MANLQKPELYLETKVTWRGVTTAIYTKGKAWFSLVR